jgi:hypothetical protein
MAMDCAIFCRKRLRAHGVSVDLYQKQLSADGRLLSFGHACGRLRSPKIKSP